MDKLSLVATAREQLRKASTASSGRPADTALEDATVLLTAVKHG